MGNDCEYCGRTCICLTKDKPFQTKKEETMKQNICQGCGRTCICMTKEKEETMKQNNCQGCGCVNQDQCICLKEELNNIMKEQYKDRYTTLHPAGVSITFTSWQDYNKYMVYNHDTRKEYCEQAYETGIKDGMKKAKESNSLQNLLIYEAGVEDGVVKAKKGKTETVEYPEKKDNPSTYVNVEVQVKVDSVSEFIDIWDVLYPKENQ